MASNMKGSCLCGRVKFEVSEPFQDFYFCHCTRCQKASGSAHASNIFARLDSITWHTGETLIKYFELSKDNYFNKSFCSECGSPLPSRAKSGEFIIIPAGSLNSSPSLSPKNNIFWAHRAKWYEGGCNSPKFEGCSE